MQEGRYLIRMVAFFWIGWAVAAVPTPSIDDALAMVDACPAPGECTVPCWDDAVRQTEPGPDGALQVSCWKGNRSHGPVVAWYANGQPLGVGYSHDEQPHGGAVSWHPTGKRASESTWVHGAREGVFRTWHPTGERASVGTWHNNRQDGVVRFWHPNVQLDEAVTWVDGQPDGPMFSWHDNGELRARARFDHGQRVGRWRLWYPSGQRSVIVRFRDGRAHHLRCWEPKGSQTICPDGITAMFGRSAAGEPATP